MNYSIHHLKNKMTVLLSPNPNTQAVTTLITINAGARHEATEVSGISHYLEHMMFKGTEKRPTALDISKEISRIGGTHNAYTGYECTGYYTTVPFNHLELSVDVLSDMFFNSKFESKEVDNERGVILEELKMYLDRPNSLASQLTHERLFGQTSLGRPVVGNPKTLSSITSKKLFNYKNKMYTGKNVIITISGNFNEKKALELVQKYFDETNYSKGLTNEINEVKSINKKRFVHFNKVVEQSTIYMTAPFKNGRFNKKKYSLDILCDVLGGNSSSRLFQKIRDELGLAYSVSTGNYVYDETGAMIVAMGIRKGKEEEAVKAVINELKNIKEKGITDEELSDFREGTKGGFMLGLESSHDIAEFLATRYLHYGKIIQIEDICKEYDKVTKKSVQQFANDIFTPENIGLTLVTSQKESVGKRCMDIIENF